jgi:hypothetical protein
MTSLLTLFERHSYQRDLSTRDFDVDTTNEVLTLSVCPGYEIDHYMFPPSYNDVIRFTNSEKRIPIILATESYKPIAIVRMKLSLHHMQILIDYIKPHIIKFATWYDDEECRRHVLFSGESDTLDFLKLYDVTSSVSLNEITFALCSASCIHPAIQDTSWPIGNSSISTQKELCSL